MAIAGHALRQVGIGPRLPIVRHTFDYAAARLVMGSRASGLQPPVYGPYTHLDDQEGYREDCHRSAVSGMTGRVILHPAQVESAHEADSKGTNLDWHRRVLAAFESAQLKGVASLQLDKQLIDYPVYAASLRALEAAVDG